ncbi:MAG: DUF4861 domain-containing protein [Marinilabiliales bacterium]|nr:DUF4861 domain-containing protein [Marinilabiliales bacterium]
MSQSARPDATLVYYAGAGWSKWGFEYRSVMGWTI